jgi:hypothetical protein
MSIDKRVLLARPHAFIVSEMGPFLAQAGYSAVRLNSLGSLPQELSRPLRGAIISTAVTSSVDADAATLFRLIREHSPGLPVVFAGMADADTMKAVTERAVKGLVQTPVITGPQGYRSASAADRASVFLVLRKEDLASGLSHDAAVKALRAHFA